MLGCFNPRLKSIDPKNMSVSKQHYKYLIVFLPSLISISLVAALFIDQGTSEDILRQANRWTARISAILLVIVFALRPLSNVFKSTPIKQQLKYRRQWGLAFGANHLVHYGTIIILIELGFDGDWSSFLTIEALPSYLIYGYIILMMLSSNHQSIQVLGPKVWKYFHSAGVYLLVIAFLSKFIPYSLGLNSHEHNFQSHELLIYQSLSLALLGTWLLRVFLWLRNWSRKKIEA